MITSCFCLAASIPPLSPRHDITVAFGASPPSENLIPTDNLTSVIVQELLYMIDNKTLQTFFLTMIAYRRFLSPNALIRA